MIQVGDPTGTGKGGQSIWGKPFPDEIRSTLKVLLCVRSSIPTGALS
jgi:cyclophilin family peptidyl-prolyl cis-trans isomerase